MEIIIEINGQALSVEVSIEVYQYLDRDMHFAILMKKSLTIRYWTDGNIGIQGNNILKGNISDGKCTGGVRPALWLKYQT